MAELYIGAHGDIAKMPSNVEAKTRNESSKYTWSYRPLSFCYTTFVPKLVLKKEMQLLEKYEGMAGDGIYFQRPVPQDDDDAYEVPLLRVKYLEEVYDAQMKMLTSHITHCMREEIKGLVRGNNMAVVSYLTNIRKGL